MDPKLSFLLLFHLGTATDRQAADGVVTSLDYFRLGPNISSPHNYRPST